MSAFAVWIDVNCVAQKSFEYEQKSVLIERWYGECSRKNYFENDSALYCVERRCCCTFKRHKYQCNPLRVALHLNMVIQNWMLNGLFKWWFELSICCYYTRLSRLLLLLYLASKANFNQLQDPLKLFFTHHRMGNRPYQSTHHRRHNGMDCVDCLRPTLNRHLPAAFACALCDDFGTTLWPKR